MNKSLKKISEKYGKEVKHFVLEDLETEGPKNYGKNPTITQRFRKQKEVLNKHLDKIGEENYNLETELIHAIINAYGEQFLDKYFSSHIKGWIENLNRKVTALKALADRSKDDPYKKRLDNWRIG